MFWHNRVLSQIKIYTWLHKNTALKYMISRRQANFLFYFFNFYKLCQPYEGGSGGFGVVNCDISVLGLNKNDQPFFPPGHSQLSYPLTSSPLTPRLPSLALNSCFYVSSHPASGCTQTHNIHFTQARQRSWRLLGVVILTFDPLFSSRCFTQQTVGWQWYFKTVAHIQF